MTKTEFLLVLYVYPQLYLAPFPRYGAEKEIKVVKLIVFTVETFHYFSIKTRDPIFSRIVTIHSHHKQTERQNLQCTCNVQLKKEIGVNV